ncbi:hypothetical protein BASA81_008053 [Batrachochytrium salamandrivorans]|nr:hypothetical protein BASA81_008053 [Batrachochytrium salamandrivorans]
MLNSVANQLTANSVRFGAKEALVEYDSSPEGGGARRSVTYADLVLAGENLAKLLKVQLAKSPASSRVAMLAGNTIECHVFYLACAILGATAVPINNSFTPSEIRQVLQSTRPGSLWFQPAYSLNAYKAVAPVYRKVALIPLPTLDKLLATSLSSSPPPLLPSTKEENTSKVLHRHWAILHTSGSTSGRKKGVIRNQFGTIAGILIHQAALKLSEKDVYLAIWPSYGISTFFFTFGLLYLGGTTVLVNAELGANANQSWQVLQRERVTFTTGSPLQFENWLELASSPTVLRVVLLSGSVVGDSLSEEICRVFPEACSVLEAYGSTECGLISLRDHRDVKSKGVGIEPPGLPQAKICPSTGEIMVNTSSPMFMNGYVHFTHHNRSTAGWFRTGDVGERDLLTGQLVLLGRADSRISLPTGHDLYPEEVEVVLRDVLPMGVGLVVTFAKNQLVGVLSTENEEDEGGDGERALLVRNLRELAEERLSPNKRPARYEFVRTRDVPLTTTMKVKRKELQTVMSARL